MDLEASCFYLCVLTTVLPTVVLGSSTTDNKTIGEWVRWKLSTDDEYNSKIRPEAQTGKTTLVDVSIHIVSISSFDQNSMEYTVDMFLRQYWIDRRMAHNFTHNITLDYNYNRMLWVPDLYFYNAKKAEFHDVTVPNVYFRVERDGRVLFSQRMSAVFTCFVKLHRYPMDVQYCHIQIESYAYTVSELMLRWRNLDQPVDASSDIRMPEFELQNFSASNCPQDTAVYSTGNFPCLKANLQFKRRVGIYLVNTYIPSVLSVMMSWVSFWIDAQAVPARTTIGLLTVLTLVTQTTFLLSTLPSVSYVKAVDVWMAACLLFVFAAFLEYAAVNVLNQKIARKHQMYTEQAEWKSKAQGQAKSLVNFFVPSAPAGKDQNEENGNKPQRKLNGAAVAEAHPEHRAKPTAPVVSELPPVEATMSTTRPTSPKFDGTRIDVWSRVLFPVVFVLFCIVYWLTYQHLPVGDSVDE